MKRDTASKTRILLADDHMVVRMGIASVLTFAGGMNVVGEADNGLDAVRLAHELKPDVVLMDLQMPALSGAEATARIHAQDPEVKVLVLTSFATSAELKKAMDAGAAGALVKSSSREEIIDAINGVMAGRQVMSGVIQATIEDFSAMPELSPRKIEILNLVAKGLSNREIAEIIGVTPETIKDHVAKILHIIGASTRAEAATTAVNLGLITG
ncbi:MAG: response regulator transcription factor [Kiritimatiellae bacterium]|nr:response regulator transcription factor [Kiritimatiellia bacterium]